MTHKSRTDRRRPKVFKLGSKVGNVTRHAQQLYKVKRSKIKITKVTWRICRQKHYNSAVYGHIYQLETTVWACDTVVWECCKDDQQSQWEMLKFDPQLPPNPLSDRHQVWLAWLRRGYLSPRKKWAQSVKGFLLPIYAKYTPPMFAYPCLLLFFGSSNRLQPRRLHGF